MEHFRILVCGDRNWDNLERIEDVVVRLVEKTKAQKVTIIEGEARGADTQGRQVAQRQGYCIDPYPADWSMGKRGGNARNTKQLKEGDPHLVAAFHDDIYNSKGTMDMIKKSALAGKPVILVTHSDIKWWGNPTQEYDLNA